MEKIKNDVLLKHYITLHGLDKIFPPGIMDHMALVSFDKGEYICRHSSRLQYMYFLVCGKLKLFIVHENGRALLLRFYKPMNVLGDIELLTDYQVGCDVQSLNKSTLIRIDSEIMKKKAVQDPRFLQFIIKHLSHKLYT